MPNVFVIRNPNVIPPETFAKILAHITPVVIDVLGPQLHPEQVRLIPTDTWRGQVHETAISLVVFMKKSPERTAQHAKLAHDLATDLRRFLEMNDLLSEGQNVKVNITLADTEIAVG